MFLQAVMQSTAITDRDQIESYVSSSIKNAFVRVSVDSSRFSGLSRIKLLVC